MATSFSLTNFLSFLLTSNPKPPPRTQLPLSSTNSPVIQIKNSSSHEKVTPLAIGGPEGAELATTLYPTLAYSNTLCFRSGYNVQVIVDENEPEEKLLNRFRREVIKAGVIQECKRRRFFENKQEEKKRKTREAAKRNRRRRPQSRPSIQTRQEAPTSKEEDDEDNWDLP